MDSSASPLDFFLVAEQDLGDKGVRLHRELILLPPIRVLRISDFRHRCPCADTHPLRVPMAWKPENSDLLFAVNIVIVEISLDQLIDFPWVLTE